MDIKDAINIEFTDNDLGTTTIKGYFKELLKTLIAEGEGFSGKRPFGNSGWDGFGEIPLIESGLLKGEIETFDDGGGEYKEVVYNSFDERDYYGLLYAAIDEIFK